MLYEIVSKTNDNITKSFYLFQTDAYGKVGQSGQNVSL